QGGGPVERKGIMRTLQEIEREFPGATDKGLTSGQVAESTRRFGRNRLTPLPREPLWKKFLGKFDEPIIKILLAAALLSMFVDLFQAKGVSPWLPAGALAAVAVVVGSALALRRGDWVPALLFAAALGLFGVGLAVGHTSIEGLAV